MTQVLESLLGRVRRAREKEQVARVIAQQARDEEQQERAKHRYARELGEQTQREHEGMFERAAPASSKEAGFVEGRHRLYQQHR